MDDRVGDPATASGDARDRSDFGSRVRPEPRDANRMLLAERDALLEATRAVETPAREIVSDLSPVATTCPFFRAQLADGSLRSPIEAPHAANRCAAIGHPERQSPRQQNFVCLTAAHTDCPRFVRGALLARKATRSAPPVTTPTLVAILVLIAAAAASFGFVLVRGGLTLPAGADAIALAASSSRPSSAGALGAAPSRAAASAPGATTQATPQPTAATTPTPTATPGPTPTPSPSPAATPTPTDGPTSPPTPQPTSTRYALLQPCTSKPDCYLYTIRRGDNLTSIARYFGVPLETVRALNPWTSASGISPGQQLVLPPPTR